MAGSDALAAEAATRVAAATPIRAAEAPASSGRAGPSIGSLVVNINGSFDMASAEERRAAADAMAAQEDLALQN